jgi:hypothetical protein
MHKPGCYYITEGSKYCQARMPVFFFIGFQKYGSRAKENEVVVVAAVIRLFNHL